MKKLYILLFVLFLFAFPKENIAINFTTGGTINSNTSWNYDTVFVNNDITIANGKKLTIAPGTYVKFLGHYKLNVLGSIYAVGTENQKITFTAGSTSVGWKGLRFDNTAATNDSSYVEYCIISYGKATVGTSEDKMGGGLFVKGFSKLLVRNCIIANNYAYIFGGGITIRINASPLIVNNVIVNNTAASKGGGIYVYSGSSPQMINNTIANNHSASGGGVYSNVATPLLGNCILYGNTATTYSQINNDVSMGYCLVQGGYPTGNRVTNANPKFISPSAGSGNLYNGLAADFSIQSTSPCIDIGYSSLSSYRMSDFDVIGNFRYDNEKIDLGAFEYISSLEACGTISTNTIWSGNVLVNCDVSVAHGRTLTILPGTKVLFTGHFKLDIDGRLLSQGTADDMVTFTAWNKTQGWKGLDFISVNAANDTSKVEYSRIEYGRATGAGTDNYGGGIYVQQTSKLLIRNCIIANNWADTYGGGIAMRYSSAKLISNLIINNTADYSYSGGVYIYGSTSVYKPTIINNTIANNKSSSYAGGYFENSSALPIFKNNILWGNKDNLGNSNAAEQIYPVSLPVTYSNIQGTLHAGLGNTNSDPLFKNPSSNAGDTYSTAYADFSLQSTSPCIDAGSSASSGISLPALDLKGKTRVYSTAIDMGAYEDKSQLTANCVISTNTVWDANIVNVNCNVVINNGVTLTINPGTEVRFNGHYKIDVDGRIVAEGTEADSIRFLPANTTTGWDGLEYYMTSSANDTSIYNYCVFEYANRTPTLSYLAGSVISSRTFSKIRLSNSRFSNNTVLGSEARGVVSFYTCSGVVKKCKFTDNTGGYGAALFLLAFNGVVRDVEIRNNTSIYNGGAIYASACRAEISNCFISNNTAANYGGAIYHYGSNISNIHSNVIVNNQARRGGAVYMTVDGKSLFYNNTFSNNYATQYGGGFYLGNNCDPLMKNNILYGDSAAYSTGGNEIYLSDVTSDPKFYNCIIEGGKDAFKGSGNGLNYGGVYQDVIDDDPDFDSPSSNIGSAVSGFAANWSITTNSPCINTGSSSISDLDLYTNDIAGNTRVYNGRIDIGAYENQDDIVSPCTITQNTVWEADTIKVRCNVTVDDNVTLEIKEGTYVLFEGYYKLNIQGRLLARGSASQPIYFSVDDTTGFSLDNSSNGGWSGIEFLSTPITNDSSIIDYCILSNAKAYETSPYSSVGGALYIYNYSKLQVSNSKIINNKAFYRGGGVFIESSNPLFYNNVIANNSVIGHTNTNGGGIFLDDANPLMYNNTICNNYSSVSGGGFYIWASSPVLKNNIIYGNENDFSTNYGNQVSLNNSSIPVFQNNNIDGGKYKINGYYYITSYINNIQIDPEFSNPSLVTGNDFDALNADWSVSQNSVCINAGSVAMSNFSSVDIIGNNRAIGDTIDMGAYEVQISPRFITSQPLGSSVCIGDPVSLSCSASIAANYQWQLNGVAIPTAISSSYIITAIAQSDTGYYNCIISNEYGAMSTDTVFVGSMTAPSILSSPSSASSCLGTSLTFNATATGTVPLAYQWTNLNGQLSGGTNTSFTINSIAANDASTYKMEVSNICGSDISTGAALIVKSKPSLNSIDAAMSICENQSFTYTTLASGGSTPISYQWYQDGSSISGANSVSYGISSAASSDDGTYYCKATNSCGNVTTNQSVFSVMELPSISSQPSSQTVCENQSMSFNVTASGHAPLTYQWYKGSSPISGATNNVFTLSSVSSSSAGSYYCVVTNSCGALNSTAVTLTVKESPAISSHGLDATVCSGNSNSFSITATGSAPLSYQWYNSSGSISGATNNLYAQSSTSVSDAGTYYCSVTNVCGTTSSAAKYLTVNTTPAIVQHPATSSACIGQSALFTATASGSVPLAYQWYKGSGTLITGANASTYLLSSISASDASTYYCKVSNSCGNVNTNSATLTVKNPVSLSLQSGDTTKCVGESYTFYTTATGSSPISYQWYSNGSAIVGATSSSYVLATISASNAGNYYCKVSNTCNLVQSNTMTLSVNTPVQIASQSSSTTVCEGGNLSLSVSASGSSPISYQWYKTGQILVGANASNYALYNADVNDAAVYYCTATNACTSVQSSNITVGVNTNPIILSQPVSQDICESSALSLSVTASSNTALSYQWYKGTSLIPLATNATYTLASMDSAAQGSYVCHVTNSCSTIQSSAAQVSMDEAPQIISQSTGATQCAGSSFSFDVSVSGTQPISYQWYNQNGVIPGAVHSLFLISSIDNTDAGSYYCVVSNTCGTLQSTTKTLVISEAPTLTSQSQNVSICEGQAATFSISATGSSPLSYQWYQDTGLVYGANSNTYTLASVSKANAGNYYCVVSNACGSVQSSIKVLNVSEVPTILSQSTSATLCEGQGMVLNVSSIGTSPMSYQWFKDTDSIPGASFNLYMLAAVDTSDIASYTCRVSNLCGNDVSSAISISVNQNISLIYQSGDSTRCEGESSSFEVQATGTGPITYQWFKGSTAIPSATSSILSLQNLSSADQGSYYCQVSNVCNTITSSAKALDVHSNPIESLGQDTSFCAGGIITLSPGLGYICQWNTGSINPQISVVQTGSYYAFITDAYGCSNYTDTVNINVVEPYAMQELCLVGVDSATNKNFVVWEKPVLPNVESFNIYKESTVQGVYNLISNRDYDSLAYIIDYSSNPIAKPDRYRISIMDSCGNESGFSPAHKTMHLSVNAGAAGAWNLIWDKYEGFVVPTYRIWRADTSLQYVLIDSVQGTTWTYVDATPPAGGLYYIVEVIKPGGACNPTKANTNFNTSRSNPANNGMVTAPTLAPKFFATPLQGSVPLVVNFYDQTPGGATYYYWLFGDGGSSSDKNPVHLYDSIGIYNVTLTVSNANGSNSITKYGYINVKTNGISEFDEYLKFQIYPNPYKESTNIKYTLMHEEDVQLEVYNVMGVLVNRFADEKQNTGTYTYHFKANDYGLSAGVYFVRLTIGGKIITKRIIEVK